MVSNRSSLSARTVRAAADPTERTALSARDVHDRLRVALTELQQAEQNAVLWFSEIVRRKLYRDLGYASIHQYAELALGWGKSKTSQFLRLSECLKELPGLRQSVARGELSWTKAREVAKVATPRTETAWIREAQQTSSRALEASVKAARKRANKAGPAGRGQVELGIPGVPSGVLSGISSGVPSTNPSGIPSSLSAAPQAPAPETPAPSVPMEVHFRMTPEQYARYQALIEAVRKNGRREDRTELMLAALEQLALKCAETAKPDGTGAVSNRPGSRPEFTRVDSRDRLEARSEFTRVHPRDRLDARSESTRVHPSDRLDARSESARVSSRSPYQVIVQQCPDCGSGRVATNRGDRKLTPQELRAVLCDAHVRTPGKRNRASVPGCVRRAVLQRDRFRCRSAGCGATSFLAVHHLVPRERGGGNALENLITLCASCHRALHAHV